MVNPEWDNYNPNLAEAYAVVANGRIAINTVASTRRAAIVNWLVIDQKVLITRLHTDEMIEKIWLSRNENAIAVKVRIEIIKEGNDDG